MDRETIESVARSLRQVNLQGSLFGQTVAIRFGLSESDVETLQALVDAGAATAGRLSELTGLTSGAITRVIDRLEQAGYVRRVADPADRRRVIVEVDRERSAAIQAVLGRLGSASAEEIGRYSDAQLALIDDFLTKMAAIAHEEATTLRDAAGAGTPSDGAGERVAPLGGLREARLLVRSGLNELDIRSSDDLDDLYRARFDGPIPEVRLREGTVSLRYKGHGKPWDWRRRHADVILNDAIPWTVAVTGGANKVEAHLAGLDLRAFELTGGVDSVRLEVGRPEGAVQIRIVGGANRIRIERTTGVAVQLVVTGGSGGIDFDGRRVGGVGGRVVLESIRASSASDRYDIEITGGSSQIVVREAAG